MAALLNFTRTYINRLLSGVIAVALFVSGGLNTVFNGDVYPYESVTRTVGLQTFERAQGVTTDGKAWYFSGRTSLVKVSLDGETLFACNYGALTKEMKEDYGSAHIGGISYYNGYIYAPIEDSKIWDNPLIALYDAETLSFTGVFKRLSPEILTEGIPWVSCDAERGVFYTSNAGVEDHLLCFGLTDFSYKGELPISAAVDQIQGGEVYNGKLYLGTNDATRAVYSVELSTGNVEKLFDRIMYKPMFIDNFGGEGEDLTVFPMEDGTTIHALNVGAMFIDSNLRHYKWKV